GPNRRINQGVKLAEQFRYVCVWNRAVNADTALEIGCRNHCSQLCRQLSCAIQINTGDVSKSAVGKGVANDMRPLVSTKATEEQKSCGPGTIPLATAGRGKSRIVHAVWDDSDFSGGEAGSEVVIPQRFAWGNKEIGQSKMKASC